MRSTDADGVLPEPSVHSDLGTEGAEDADIQLRKCLSGPNPLIPGPRYFCANRAIIASGSYGEFPVQTSTLWDDRRPDRRLSSRPPPSHRSEEPAAVAPGRRRRRYGGTVRRRRGRVREGCPEAGRSRGGLDQGLVDPLSPSSSARRPSSLTPNETARAGVRR